MPAVATPGELNDVITIALLHYHTALETQP